MKPPAALATARESAVANGIHPRRQFLRWTLAGLSVGVVSATAYLLLGGEYFFTIPRWASVAFLPGFVAGFKAYDLCRSEPAAKVVGVLAVGLAYATVAALARFGWFALKRRRQSEP